MVVNDGNDVTSVYERQDMTSIKQQWQQWVGTAGTPPACQEPEAKALPAAFGGTSLEHPVPQHVALC